MAQGDVIALPDEVFVPVPARAGQRRTWVWRGRSAHLLDNAHRWRWVYDVDQLDEDETGFAESLPLGFRLLRVSDDRADQGQQYRSLVIAVREHDLVGVHVGTLGPVQNREPDRVAPGSAVGGDPVRPLGTVPAFAEYAVRDARVRVFDRSTEAGSDDASDMYVLEVLGVSVLVRLRTTHADHGSRPQLYVHIDNETRQPTCLAVQVANGGQTHYRI